MYEGKPEWMNKTDLSETDECVLCEHRALVCACAVCGSKVCMLSIIVILSLSAVTVINSNQFVVVTSFRHTIYSQNVDGLHILLLCTAIQFLSS